MFTHRHADGGFYSFVCEANGEHPDTDKWVEGVCYKGVDGQVRWTSYARWLERFDKLPPHPSDTAEAVVARNDDDEVLAAYSFQVQDIGDVRAVLISAADYAHKRRDKALETVLRSQAEIISTGLHIRDIDYEDLMGDVNAFHVKFDHAQEHYGLPKVLPGDLFDFRVKFHDEETTEYRDEQPKLVDAVARGDHREIVNSLELQLDALCDAVWVLLGTADIQFGKKVFYEAWRRVVKANMSKVRADRADDGATDSGRNKKFDIVKPAGWLPPDHRDLVQDYLAQDPGQQDLFDKEPVQVPSNYSDTRTV